MVITPDTTVAGNVSVIGRVSVANVVNFLALGLNDSTQNKMSTGSFTCGTAVTFANAFSASPVVVATVKVAQVIVAVTTGPNTTGFTPTCVNRSDGSVNSAATGSWIAVGQDTSP